MGFSLRVRLNGLEVALSGIGALLVILTNLLSLLRNVGSVYRVHLSDIWGVGRCRMWERHGMPPTGW